MNARLEEFEHQTSELEEKQEEELQYRTRLSEDRVELSRRIEVSQRAAGNGHGTIPELAAALLKERDAEMRPKDIAEVLTARGVTSSSEKGLLPNVVSALNRRDDLFYKVKRGVFGLSEWYINGEI